MEDDQDEEAQLQQILEQSRREAQQQQQSPSSSSSTSSASSSASTSASSSSGGISQEQARLFAQQFQSMAAAALRAREEADQLRLTDILKSERVAGLLDQHPELVGELSPHLPLSQQTPADLRAQLSSPQLRQALNHLQQVCSSPEYSQLLLSLQLPMDAAMGVEGFLAAIQAQADQEKAQEGKPEEDGAMKDDEE